MPNFLGFFVRVIKIQLTASSVKYILSTENSMKHLLQLPQMKPPFSGLGRFHSALSLNGTHSIKG